MTQIQNKSKRYMDLNKFKILLEKFNESDGVFYIKNKKTYTAELIGKKYLLYQRIRKGGYRFAQDRTQSRETIIQISVITPSHNINLTNKFEEFMEMNGCIMTLVDDYFNDDDNYAVSIYETYIKE